MSLSHGQAVHMHMPHMHDQLFWQQTDINAALAKLNMRQDPTLANISEAHSCFMEHTLITLHRDAAFTGSMSPLAHAKGSNRLHIGAVGTHVLRGPSGLQGNAMHQAPISLKFMGSTIILYQKEAVTTHTSALVAQDGTMPVSGSSFHNLFDG